jgi:AcrR family transcriptional regulator
VSTADVAVVSRRERQRAATTEEIKATALQLMRDQGTTDVRFSDIARVMGMTAPALYRYFRDRDELLTALIADAYDDLADAVADAREAVPQDAVGDRLLAVATAYRVWARAEPQRFTLIFGLPVPGYVAPDEGPTTESAKRAMAQLAALFVDASRRRKLRKPLMREVGEALCLCVAQKHGDRHGDTDMTDDLPAETHQAMLHVWTALHGFTCLETFGHFDWLDEDARDDLFAGQVRLSAKAAGLPEPSTA